MFTGLVRAIGNVAVVDRGDDGATLRISAPLAVELADGDSVAVDGVCLTATEVTERGFAAQVMNQTLGLTTLGGLGTGARVNLEPALRAGDAMGGHIVQGHVDGIGEVAAIAEDGFARRIAVSLPAELRRYVVEHGSVTLNGTSLTVAALTDTGFEVSLIPETLARTNLGDRALGEAVNVEVDVIARYVERLVRFKSDD